MPLLLTRAWAGLDFDRIIYCNIGNPQQLQQKPITFFRQACPPPPPQPYEPSLLLVFSL